MPSSRYIISVCKNKEKQEGYKESVCESKGKHEIFFFSLETDTGNIVIDFIIIKLIWSLYCGFFPSRRKGFPHKYLYFCV